MSLSYIYESQGSLFPKRLLESSLMLQYNNFEYNMSILGKNGGIGKKHMGRYE